MNSIKRIIFARAAWLASAGAALADVASGGVDGYGHGHMSGGWGWGGMLFGPFFTLAFIAAIAVAVVFVARAIGSGNNGGGDGSRALDILDERFARGEIDREEYEERRRVLTGS